MLEAHRNRGIGASLITCLQQRVNRDLTELRSRESRMAALSPNRIRATGGRPYAAVAARTRVEQKRQLVDVTGLVVAPGFIDWHAHGQNTLADRVQAFDGVTTALELEAGMLPIGRWYDLQAKSHRVVNYGAASSSSDAPATNASDVCWRGA